MKTATCGLAFAIFSLATFVPAPAASDAPRGPAAWDGAERSVVTAMLGEPDKVKNRPGGGEVLTYKLVRLVPGAVPGPGQRVIDVPGIGTCVTTAPHPDPGVKESTAFEPTAVDENGRPVAGGMTTTQSKTVSWGKEGKPEGADTPPPAAAGGKVKLEMTLGAGGRVETWSVSPKR